MGLNMSDYKPNSHKYKSEQKAAEANERQIKGVASGTVKKKSEVQKLANMFISDDASNLKSLLLTDVIIPRITQLVCDGVQYACDVIFKGRRDGGSNRSYGTSYTSYSSFSSNRNTRYAGESTTMNRFDHDDILFRTSSDADAVLTQMEECIDKYGLVTVADMYDMARLRPPHTGNKFGWMSLRSAEIRRVGGGWIIKLPDATPIER